jgi:signal transduction histidine kinase
LRGVPRFTSNAFLAASLHAVLLLIYTLICYIMVLALGSLTNPIVTDPFAPVPLWLNAVALLLSGLSAIPLGRWLRHSLDELLLGWPDDPYGTLSQLQADLARAPSPQAIVPAVAAIIATTLRLPYAAITDAAGETIAIGTPPVGAELLRLPLVYGAASVGTLEVAARRPSTTLTTGELRLLHDLARQVGITLYAAQLSEALQASRTQLVAAREEERLRMRRDLHDGLGPTLAALKLQLGAARRTLRADPAAAEALLDELRADVADATAAIRRLVYDLRPPMLDEHGLVGALGSLARLVEPAPLRLELPAALPPLPAAVEVALYRIAAEAVHNVARHAHATGCTLTLAVEDEMVSLRVSDTGAGLPAGHKPGVGLNAMRERAEELGGTLSLESTPGVGLMVSARIPRRTENPD